MRRVNILGVEISAVNKETAIQYLLENMDKARGKYICACNVHTTVTQIYLPRALSMFFNKY